MDKFLKKPQSDERKAGDDSSSTVPLAFPFDLTSIDASKLVDDSLKNVPLDKRMEKLMSLEKVLQGCSNYLAELIKKESKRIVSTSCEASTGTNDTIFEHPDASFLEPRGKFSVVLREKGLLVEGKSGNFFLPWSNVTALISLPNPSTTKKGTDIFLFFILKEIIPFGKRQLKTACWNLSQGQSSDISISYGPLHFKGNITDAIPKLSSALVLKPLAIPDNSVFRTPSGKNYLSCYKGVQEGVIFPLKEGVLFFKPPLFIPSEEVESIVAGRGGSSVTRYIDLKVETADEKIFEFSNISRDHLPAIQQYVEYFIELRKKESKDNAEGTSHSDDDSNSESDDDYLPGQCDAGDSESELSCASENNEGRVTSQAGKSNKWEMKHNGDIVEANDDSCDDSDGSEEESDDDDGYATCSGDEIECLKADLSEQENVEGESCRKRQRLSSR